MNEFRLRHIFLLLLLVVIIAAGCKSVTIVDYGNVKLVTEFGALTGQVFEEGLNFKAPWQGVSKWTVRTLSYETSSNPKESQADYTDFPIDGLTKDGQQVLAMRYTTLFRVRPECTIQVSRKYGGMEAVVENIVKAHSRNLGRSGLSAFTAEDLAGEITSYESYVAERLAVALENECVTLVGFLVRKPDLDPDYLAAIERQQIAQEDIETAEYRAQQEEFEKARVITAAEGQKERQILEAQGQAESVKLLADADAYAISVKGVALEEYPNVLSLNFIEQLARSDYMIIPDSGITPLIPIPPSGSQQALPNQ